MKSKVTVTANPANNQVFTPNTTVGKDGQQYGYIRLEQRIVDMKSAVASVKTISALKTMRASDFEIVKSELTAGTKLDGKIIRKETVDAKIHLDGVKSGYTVKRAGKEEDAPICSSNGLPIYQTTEFTEDESAQDVLVAHTNGEEIKAYQEARKTALNA